MRPFQIDFWDFYNILPSPSQKKEWTMGKVSKEKDIGMMGKEIIKITWEKKKKFEKNAKNNWIIDNFKGRQKSTRPCLIIAALILLKMACY